MFSTAAHDTALVLTMAGGRASPTATLLRNSRLFSLPPPLPRPSQAFKGSSVYESLTATSLYPTHAAIQTTQSSIPRGDWGLKQSLPSRTIGKTPNSTIRIGDIETIDHITDFESATDLTMTLLKFQAFELPITRPRRSPPKASAPRALARGISVFESSVDNIQTGGNSTAERWKFKGPWLALETEKGFQEYIRKTISGQKTAFRKFLRKELAQKESKARRERARNEGTDVSQDPIKVSDQQVDDYIRHLRSDPKELRALVEEFLDLPRALGFSNSNGSEAGLEAERNYAFTGPPKTHPSAGLTYLRTASRVHNHPILGPQDVKLPIQGRFLTPQVTASGRRRTRALVGIGGVVAADSSTRYQSGGDLSGNDKSEPDTKVGSKYWFRPERASVSSSGRINLTIQRTDKADLTLFTGIEEEKPDPKDEHTFPDVSRIYPTQSKSWRQGSLPATQGYGIENETEPQRLKSNGRARPLDLKDAHATSAILNLGRLNGHYNK